MLVAIMLVANVHAVGDTSDCINYSFTSWFSASIHLHGGCSLGTDKTIHCIGVNPIIASR